ncbi:peptidase inhibitor family I36 protein [Amycolatopsis magusensis]|uniref:peptidase inhibitor family I36 protein n=1 Tax=Amycolatopsis magusensis TaxID=882444 RepID=UPI0037BA8BD2
MRRIINVCAALGLATLAAATPAAATSGATQTPHAAASATLECPPDWFCAWALDSGRRLATQVSIPDLGIYGMDNHVDYLWNRTSVMWCAHQGISYTGPAMIVNPGSRVGIWQQEGISSLLRAC